MIIIDRACVALLLQRHFFDQDREEALADVGNNADLYAANQESTDLINEPHMEEVPLRFMGQDVLYFLPFSLD